MRPHPQDDRRRSARRARLRLQPRLLPVRQHAAGLRDGFRDVQDAARGDGQRHDDQHGLRYGRLARVGHHHERKDCQLLHHQADGHALLHELRLRFEQGGAGVLEGQKIMKLKLNYLDYDRRTKGIDY